MADDRNPTFDDHSPDDHERVRQTYLHLATVRCGHEDADLEADALGLVQALLRLLE